MRNILIIDDDEELFSLLADYLNDEDFACLPAPDAATGLTLAGQSGVDAVILDVMLPGMNGFEVLRRLRANEATRDLPVLMLTARGRKSTGWWAWKWAPTTTWANLSAPESWWPGCGPFCAARAGARPDPRLRLPGKWTISASIRLRTAC